jgi:hypothetical protein
MTDTRTLLEINTSGKVPRINCRDFVPRSLNIGMCVCCWQMQFISISHLSVSRFR